MFKEPTLTIVPLVLKFPAVSLALAVKFIMHVVQLIVMFWLNCALVPEREKLKYLLKPVSSTIICPKLRFCMSVALADMLMTSLKTIFDKDLFNDAFTTGAVASIVKFIVRFSDIYTPSLMLTFNS